MTESVDSPWLRTRLSGAPGTGRCTGWCTGRASSNPSCACGEIRGDTDAAVAASVLAIASTPDLLRAPPRPPSTTRGSEVEVASSWFAVRVASAPVLGGGAAVSEGKDAAVGIVDIVSTDGVGDGRAIGDDRGGMARRAPEPAPPPTATALSALPLLSSRADPAAAF